MQIDEGVMGDGEFEAICCDKCKISSKDFDGQWLQNKEKEGEYLCEVCMTELLRNNQPVNPSEPSNMPAPSATLRIPPLPVDQELDTQASISITGRQTSPPPVQNQ